MEPELELELTMEPEPEPELEPEVPMTEWTVAQTTDWVVHMLRLPEVAAQLQAEFERQEFDGEELASITTKRLQKIMQKIMPATDPAAACRAVLDARAEIQDARLLATTPVSPAQEALPPPSTRWRLVLASAGPARRVKLQTVLDQWHRGRWVIEEQELGSGGSGAVFRSSDSDLGQVAIKFSYNDEPHRMDREVRLMKRVGHDRICRMHEHHAADDGRLFGMMLELLEAGSLAQRIKASTDGYVQMQFPPQLD